MCTYLTERIHNHACCRAIKHIDGWIPKTELQLVDRQGYVLGKVLHRKLHAKISGMKLDVDFFVVKLEMQVKRNRSRPKCGAFTINLC